MAVWVPEDPAMARPVPKATIANTSRASASHVNPGDTLDALSDGITGSGPADRSVPRFTWWDRRGTKEWVQYEFKAPAKVGAVKVYWFDDTTVGGGCATPGVWQVTYRDGGDWKPVKYKGAASDTAKQGTGPGPVETRIFEPVETSAMRLEVTLPRGQSGGVLEWQVTE
jgi:uncharacterized protein